MRIPRSITSKLAVLFVAVGIVPMIALGLFSYFTVREKLARSAVEYFVSRVAHDTAQRLDTVLSHMSQETTYLATDSEFCRLIKNLQDAAQSVDSPAGRDGYHQLEEHTQRVLNERAQILQDVDLFVVLDKDGRVLITSSLARPGTTGRFGGPEGAPWLYLWGDPAQNPQNPLRFLPLAERPWWSAAKTGEPTFIDCDVEDAVAHAYEYPTYLDREESKPPRWRQKNPEAFAFGFTRGVPTYDEKTGRGDANRGPYQAFLVAFYNWTAIQDLLDNVDLEFAQLHPRYSSGYAFMFRSDLDTVIAHKERRNYLTSLVQDHKLPQFREAMLAAGDRDGVCAYAYRRPKSSGFSKVGVYGWRLGFGIDEQDIFADVEELRNRLLLGGLAISAVIIAAILATSRALTRPITDLIRGTNEIARGNLDARVHITTRDEIARLGESFNKMAADLKASSQKLIQAEKTAAWEQMARQVAHEIKNPLTPMKLSAQLLERAFNDKHPDFPRILKEGVATIVGQIESLRKIASDFSRYAVIKSNTRKPCAVRALIEDSVRLYSNRDASSVEIRTDLLVDGNVHVFADADELKRVFLNLFNNSFEAMPDGGVLTVSAVLLHQERLGRVVDIRVKDTGRGIPLEVQTRLFEPYFTTRTSGTGLGLAIARKTIESYGGTIAISSYPGAGTTVTILLPVMG
jgi:signal transduction histidine kinase